MTPYDEVRVARVSSRSLHFWTALACDVLLVRALPPCLFALITYVTTARRRDDAPCCCFDRVVARHIGVVQRCRRVPLFSSRSSRTRTSPLGAATVDCRHTSLCVKAPTPDVTRA